MSNYQLFQNCYENYAIFQLVVSVKTKFKTGNSVNPPKRKKEEKVSLPTCTTEGVKYVIDKEENYCSTLLLSYLDHKASESIIGLENYYDK